MQYRVTLCVSTELSRYSISFVPVRDRTALPGAVLRGALGSAACHSDRLFALPQEEHLPPPAPREEHSFESSAPRYIYSHLCKALLPHVPAAYLKGEFRAAVATILGVPAATCVWEMSSPVDEFLRTLPVAPDAFGFGRRCHITDTTGKGCGYAPRIVPTALSLGLTDRCERLCATG